jgi:hypothetical protein
LTPCGCCHRAGIGDEEVCLVQRECLESQLLYKDMVVGGEVRHGAA